MTENCGLLRHLLPGDMVLADRGFDVSESVPLPAFMKGKDQLSHVERVIGSVKQKYTILQGTLPIDFVALQQEESVPINNQIGRVCCS